MWINRREYGLLLGDIAEYKVKFLMEQRKASAADDSLKEAIEEIRSLKARVAEVEGKLLQREDEMQAMRKVSMSPAPVDVGTLFEEDETEVVKLRERIQRDGAEAVLAEVIA